MPHEQDIIVVLRFFPIKYEYVNINNSCFVRKHGKKKKTFPLSQVKLFYVYSLHVTQLNIRKS